MYCIKLNVFLFRILFQAMYGYFIILAKNKNHKTNGEHEKH